MNRSPELVGGFRQAQPERELILHQAGSTVCGARVGQGDPDRGEIRYLNGQQDSMVLHDFSVINGNYA